LCRVTRGTAGLKIASRAFASVIVKMNKKLVQQLSIGVIQSQEELSESNEITKMKKMKSPAQEIKFL
jgi:hypothetical protein